MINVSITFAPGWCAEKRKDMGNITRGFFKAISAGISESDSNDSLRLVTCGVNELSFNYVFGNETDIRRSDKNDPADSSVQDSNENYEKIEAVISQSFSQFFNEEINDENVISLAIGDRKVVFKDAPNTVDSTDMSAPVDTMDTIDTTDTIDTIDSIEATETRDSTDADVDSSQEPDENEDAAHEIIQNAASRIAAKSKQSSKSPRNTRVSRSHNISLVNSDNNNNSDEDLVRKIDELCMQVPMRYSAELQKFIKELGYMFPEMKRLSVDDAIYSDNILLGINEGYGLEQFATAVNCILNENYDGSVINDRKKRIKPIIIKSLQNMNNDEWSDFCSTLRSVCRSKDTKAVAIDISGCYTELEGHETIKKLNEIKNICSEVMAIYRIPCLDYISHKKVKECLSGVMSLKSLVVNPVSMDNMVNYVEDKLGSHKFTLTDSGREQLGIYIEQIKEEDLFLGYDTLNDIVDKVIREKIYQSLFSKNRDSKNVIDLNVFNNLINDYYSVSGEDPYVLLSDLIGIAEVKEKVREIIKQIKVQKELERQGKNIEKPCIHMQFIGAPGTGKTTVARLVGNIMKKEGILSRGKFFEKKGRDFCGRYVGETTPKTTAICKDAYGSVLFIDEAYSLASVDSDRDYGKEAVAALIAEMENHKDDMCVIFAGYEEDMSKLYSLNEGLESRIPHKIKFPNYSRDELSEIFMHMIDGKFEFEDSLKETLDEYLMSIPDEIINNKSFSNGRFIRNLYERVWGKASGHFDPEVDNSFIVKSADFRTAINDPEFKDIVKNNAKKNPMGF